MTAISVKKSYKDGHLALHVTLKARGWQSDSIKVDGSTDLTTEQARALAASLIAEAERVEAKVTAKTASENRRKNWRDREIAAGRIKVVTLNSLLGK